MFVCVNGQIIANSVSHKENRAAITNHRVSVVNYQYILSASSTSTHVHVTHEAEPTNHTTSFNSTTNNTTTSYQTLLPSTLASQWQLPNRPPHCHIPLAHTSTSSSRPFICSTLPANPHILTLPSPPSQPHRHSNNASKPLNGVYITSSKSTITISTHRLHPFHLRCIYSPRHSPFPQRLPSIH